MSVTLGIELRIPRCPHCNVDNPSMTTRAGFDTKDSEGRGKRTWRAYGCARCGGVVTACAPQEGMEVGGMFPQPVMVDLSISGKAHRFLTQAIHSIHAPAGAVMLAASAVDAMLKEKGYSDGSLYARINAAASDHLITKEMATWAHEVRLDANDQRHADSQADLPSEADAQRCVEFALALAQFLFVLPARVQRGLEDAAKKAT
jgi:Domain of unknown function (DUF4145)